MRRPCSLYRLAALMIVALGAIRGTARADIPSGSLIGTREGDRLLIEIVWGYHGNIDSFCDGVLDRREDTNDSTHLVFDGDLGRKSMVCRCGKWYTWEEGMEDATGEECESSSFFDLEGTCPENHACNCTITCNPFHDSPCNGSYVYSFASRGYNPTGRNVVKGKIDVTWARDECYGEGRGCSYAGIDLRPHFVMLILFVLGAGVPLALRHLGRRRPSLYPPGRVGSHHLQTKPSTMRPEGPKIGSSPM